MSHSYKHTPIFGNTSSRSSKSYKHDIHQIERARVREALAHGDWEAAQVELCPWNSYDDPRDGKVYRANFYPSSGWGIQHDRYRWNSSWTKEHADKAYRRALRK